MHKKIHKQTQTIHVIDDMGFFSVSLFQKKRGGLYKEAGRQEEEEVGEEEKCSNLSLSVPLALV